MDKKINVNFTEDHSNVSVNVGTYLSGLTVKTPVTVMLDVSAYVGSFDFSTVVVKQGSKNITAFTLAGNTFILVREVFPLSRVSLLESMKQLLTMNLRYIQIQLMMKFLLEEM